MQEKQWGTFLCDCRSSLSVDLEKIGDLDCFVQVATDPDKEIHAFAEKIEEKGLKNIIIGCCSDKSIFRDRLKNKNLHFLDLKGKCFLPHDDIEKSHKKANSLINAEIEGLKIKSKITVPINPLQVGKSVLIFTEFKEGFKLASMLEEKLDGTEHGAVTMCISPKLEKLENISNILSFILSGS